MCAEVRIAHLWRRVVLGMLVALVGLSGCSFFGPDEIDPPPDEPDPIPVRLEGLEEADALVIRYDEGGAYNRPSVLVSMVDGSISGEVRFVNVDGETVQYPVHYVYQPTPEYLVVRRFEPTSGLDLTLRAGLLLVELATGEASSLTPPVVADALAVVDAGTEDSCAYGQIDFHGWRGRQAESYSPWGDLHPPFGSCFYVNDAGAFLYNIGSEIIVDGPGSADFGAGNWYYTEELVLLDPEAMIQTVEFRTSTVDVGAGLFDEPAVTDYYMDAAGTIYYTVRIGNTAPIHYRRTTGGTLEVSDSAPGVSDSRHVWSDGTRTFFLHQDESVWTVRELLSDGSADELLTLPEGPTYDAMPVDAAVGDTRYFISVTGPGTEWIVNVGLEWNPGAMYRYSDDGTIGPDSDPLPLEVEGADVEAMRALAVVGPTVYMMGRIVGDPYYTLLAVDPALRTVTRVPGIDHLVVTDVLQHGTGAIVISYSSIDLETGLMVISDTGSVGAFVTDSPLLGSGGELLPVVLLP